MATIKSVVRNDDRDSRSTWTITCDDGSQFMGSADSDGRITVWWRNLPSAAWFMIYKPKVIKQSPLLKIVGIVEDFYNEEPAQ